VLKKKQGRRPEKPDLGSGASATYVESRAGLL